MINAEAIVATLNVIKVVCCHNECSIEHKPHKDIRPQYVTTKSIDVSPFAACEEQVVNAINNATARYTASYRS